MTGETRAPADRDAVRIRRLHSVTPAEVDALAAVLVACTDAGASVGFLAPLPPARARQFWNRVADGVAAGARALLVAEDEEGVVGTVHLVLEQPDNGPHRADLVKMLVHPRGRRRGIGAALLVAAEELARACGKTLLVLDTNEGSDAERLYARHGWERVGSIPDYSVQHDGRLHPTVLFYRRV